MNGKNNINIEKFLILGGSGYLGSLFVKELKKQDVFIYLHNNNKNNNNKNKDKNIKVIKGDITKKNFWKKYIVNIDYLINFASAENTFVNKKSLELDYDVNVKAGVYALINAYKFNNKVRIIFFGSENQEVNLNLKPKPKQKINNIPYNFFGLNKDSLEKYSMYFKYHLNLNIVFLRFSNIYGPSTNNNI
jgi:nucleoside-diphosphate-sugar epimerase